MGFGESFHTRFGADGDAPDRDFYAAALGFIRDFVEEQVVLATARQDGEWLGAWGIDRRREDPAAVEVDPGVAVAIRSWRGTWDRDLQG